MSVDTPGQKTRPKTPNLSPKYDSLPTVNGQRTKPLPNDYEREEGQNSTNKRRGWDFKTTKPWPQYSKPTADTTTGTMAENAASTEDMEIAVEPQLVDTQGSLHQVENSEMNQPNEQSRIEIAKQLQQPQLLPAMEITPALNNVIEQNVTALGIIRPEGFEYDCYATKTGHQHLLLTGLLAGTPVNKYGAPVEAALLHLSFSTFNAEISEKEITQACPGTVVITSNEEGSRSTWFVVHCSPRKKEQ